MANEPVDSTAHATTSPFQSMVGQWSGNTRVWFEDPTTPVDDSPCEGSFTSILNDKALRWDYTGMFQGKPLTGTALFAYSKKKKEFAMSWMDTFHTGSGILHCTGQPLSDGFSVLGSYEDPSGGPDWGWRTEFHLTGTDSLTITMYNIMPDKSESKGVETVLKRK